MYLWDLDVLSSFNNVSNHSFGIGEGQFTLCLPKDRLLDMLRSPSRNISILLSSINQRNLSLACQSPAQTLP